MLGATMNTTVIGIDFATKRAKTGLARATVDNVSGHTLLHEVCTASAQRPRLKIVADWLAQRCNRMPTLIAIDAPLGWPDAMKDEPFTSHKAGKPLDICANRLFSRETDRQIHKRMGKRPLEVGAALIARTAHGALSFLQRLRAVTDQPLSVAWRLEDLERGPCVVEVYPAATMIAHDISTGSYKKPGEDGRNDRERIVEALLKLDFKLDTDTDRGEVTRTDDTVDAALCVLAGKEFLAGCARAPDDDTRPIAHLKGWIWASDHAADDVIEKFSANPKVAGDCQVATPDARVRLVHRF